MPVKLYLPDYLLSTLSTKLDKISKHAVNIKTQMHTDIVSIDHGQFAIDDANAMQRLEPSFESATNIANVGEYLGKRWIFDATVPHMCPVPVNQFPVKYISTIVKISEYVLPKTEHITLVVSTMGINSVPVDFYLLCKNKGGAERGMKDSVIADNNLKGEINKFLSYLY